MSKTWLCSDWHFGHTNAVMKFVRPDGTPLRDFPTVEDMDNFLIAEHNSRVSDEDTVYFLGDAVINKKYLWKVAQMKGRKTLVPGNHDNQHVDVYREYFDNIRGYIDYKYEQAILSHIPIHPSQLERFHLNIHGHLHYNVQNDPRYLNVSMEQIQYAPITMEEAFARAKRNEAQFKLTNTVINFANEERHEP